MAPDGMPDEKRGQDPKTRPAAAQEERGGSGEPDAAFYLRLLGRPSCKVDGTCDGCGRCAR